MIECYSITLSEKVILDKDSNNFSSINMIQEVRVNPLGIFLPFSILSYWTSEKYEPFSIKIKMILEDKTGKQVDCSDENQISIDKPLFRVRINGIKIPTEEGKYKMKASWIFETGESSISTAYWNLTINQQTVA